MIERKERAAVLARLVGYQFPKMPEAQLMFAVIEKAILDLAAASLAAGAWAFLMSDLPQADLCGVSPAWIRKMVKRSGLKPEARPAANGRAARIRLSGAVKVCGRRDCRFNGRPQPVEDFDRSMAAKDGRQSYCKDCRRRLNRRRGITDWRSAYPRPELL